MLVTAVLAVLLGAEAGFVLLQRKTIAAPNLAPAEGRYKDLSTGIMQDPRFRKLSLASLQAVDVGATGRENPFLPTEEGLIDSVPSSTPVLSASSTP